MSTAFDAAFRRVKELVADFKANDNFYLSPQFSEAQARKDFIDKFFIALGWDVNHDAQKNPYEQEVKIEKNESGSQRRADYAFFLGPNFHDIRFFAEAKKPHGEFGSPDNYFQTLRYGWSGKTPLAILTNFEELHILDSRFKPNIGDTLSRIVKRFSYADYADAEKFAEIYWLFSREALANNSLAKFADTLPKPRSKTFRRELFKGGYQSLDEAFLIELDNYREMLARAFKSKNPNLNSEQLTEITQRSIDRLVFIRFLEDKQIESARHVERFGENGNSAWKDFVDVSTNLDRIYNGVVFKRHEILDAPGFQIDEKPFRLICDELSDPTSPYNFDAIPIHILGSIYERFLGKIITDGARIEEKPEVRKAGGVYYTPEYIVRYIVANTVGKAIEGKTPTEIAGMKFADIACGSGSFLLEVFDLLIRFHTKFYNENPGKMKKGDCVKRDDGLHLSLKKKQEILRNNIYGVDIDRQAVEVAQLSLYLKLLEDETIGTTHAFQNEFHYTLLPPLNENIICGNSLIGPDIWEMGQTSSLSTSNRQDACATTFTPEEEKKLNPMDFAQRFPQIFRRRRGDESQTLKENSETSHVVSYGSDELRDATPGELAHNIPGGMPLHGSYAKVSYRKSKKEKSIALSRDAGEYEGGFDAIVGNPPYGAELNSTERNHLQKHFDVSITDTAALFILQQLRLLKPNGFGGYIVPKPLIYASNWKEIRKIMMPVLLEICDCSKVWQEVKLEQIIYRLQKSSNKKTYQSSVRRKETIENLGEIEKQLCQQFDFILSNVSPTEVVLASKLKKSGKYFSEIIQNQRGAMLQGNVHLTKGKLKVIGGKQIARYGLAKTSKGFIDKKAITDENAFVGKNSALVQNIVAHILNPTDHIQIIATVLPEEWRKKVIILDTVNQLSVKTPWSAKFVAALLNSQLINWFVYRFIFARAIRTMHFDSPVTDRIPFPVMRLDDDTDKARHDKLVSLVEKMLETRKQLSAAKTDGDKDFYSHKCATLDRQIDSLVYELYALTEDEIKIVEGS
ncbi:MAG TPA: N-6 DNA methylase [Verrucomicrobiae bacterium]